MVGGKEGGKDGVEPAEMLSLSEAGTGFLTEVRDTSCISSTGVPCNAMAEAVAVELVALEDISRLSILL